jgi:hypothetical protein
MPVNATRARQAEALPLAGLPLPGRAIAAGTDRPASFAAHICLTFIRAMVARADFGSS